MNNVNDGLGVLNEEMGVHLAPEVENVPNEPYVFAPGVANENQLALSFWGQVYVSDHVSPDQVEAIIWQLSRGPQLPFNMSASEVSLSGVQGSAQSFS